MLIILQAKSRELPRKVFAACHTTGPTNAPSAAHRPVSPGPRPHHLESEVDQESFLGICKRAIPRGDETGWEHRTRRLIRHRRPSAPASEYGGHQPVTRTGDSPMPTWGPEPILHPPSFTSSTSFWSFAASGWPRASRGLRLVVPAAIPRGSSAWRHRQRPRPPYDRAPAPPRSRLRSNRG